MEDSFDIINSKTKPLAAYLFTKDKKLEEKFVNTVSAGGMLVNDTALHVSFCLHLPVTMHVWQSVPMHVHIITSEHSPHSYLASER